MNTPVVPASHVVQGENRRGVERQHSAGSDREMEEMHSNATSSQCSKKYCEHKLFMYWKS